MGGNPWDRVFNFRKVTLAKPIPGTIEEYNELLENPPKNPTSFEWGEYCYELRQRQEYLENEGEI